MKIILDSQQTIPETQEQESEKTSTTAASSIMEMSQDLQTAQQLFPEVFQVVL
jgi:hypothetical protein